MNYERAPCLILRYYINALLHQNSKELFNTEVDNPSTNTNAVTIIVSY